MIGTLAFFQEGLALGKVGNAFQLGFLPSFPPLIPQKKKYASLLKHGERSI